MKTDPYEKPEERGELYKDGLTVRDHFAARAMQGLLSQKSEAPDLALASLADYAYDIADAMMDRREKRSR